MEHQEWSNPNEEIAFAYGKAYVKWVYDSCINEVLNERYGIFIDEINQLLSAFPIKSRSTIMNGVPQFIFFLSVLWFDYLDRHEEYQILIESGSGDRIPLPKGNGLLKEVMMGEGGMIDNLSNHCKYIELYKKQVLESISSVPQILEKNKLPYKANVIPDYYEKRSYLKRFAMSLMHEVYDLAILCGFTQICSYEGLTLENAEQRENLHHFIHLISHNFILKATGIFESCDFWFVEIREGRKTHISYTDPDNADFERWELSSDMHDIDEDGIINVFSFYGCYHIP